MPWQRLVADVGGELLEDGRPAFREVVVTVPRQSGKTQVVLAWEVQRAVGWADSLGPQRIVYSAQTGNDARKKLVEDQFPLLRPRLRDLGIVKMTQGMGAEGVVWANGSRLVLLANSEDSGHGKTVDLAVKDELFADRDFRRDQALVPAMSTRSHGQMLTASTMGTADSLALIAKVEQGRAAAEAGKTTGIAYFEWSATLEDDPADPQTWWSCMPALGRTIGLEAVEHAYQSMKLGEFRRAYTNVMTSSDEQVIPRVSWDLVCVPDLEATAAAFGVDVNPERSAAGIVAAGPGPILEVVEYRAGVGWLVERCRELSGKYGAPFVVDASGPAASFVADFEREQIPFVVVAPKDSPRAAGAFYDAVVNDQVRVCRDPDLDAAVAGASKRSVGDAWAWGRKSSRSDISLLVAATVAHWHVIQAVEPVASPGYFSLSEVE